MKPEGINKICNMIREMLLKAEIDIDGETIDLDIYKVAVTGSNIRIMVYIDGTIRGAITAVRLIDIDSQVFWEKIDLINKGADGLYVAFDLTLQEVAS